MFFIKQLNLTGFFLFIILCSSICNVAGDTVVDGPPISGWLAKETEIDRSEIPKNILVVNSLEGYSHIRYTLTIGNVLADRGYNVTFATTGTFPQSPQYPKIHFVSLGDSKDIRYSKDIVYGSYDLSAVANLLERQTKNFKETFLNMKKIAEELVKPDLFLCSAVYNEACFDVAKAMNKPSIGVAIAFVGGRLHTPYKSEPMFMEGCKVNMEHESFWQRFRCEMFLPFKFMMTFGPVVKKFDEVRVSLGLPSQQSPLDYWKNSLFLVDNFFDYFPPLTPDLENFITAHKRTMFVALGTHLYLTPENNAKLLQSIVETVENNIVDGVIWSLVQTKKEDFPPSITLSDGRNISTLDVLNNKNPNIHIIPYAPQFAILNHTNVKVFLSHVGAGSVYESLYTGTPILAFPISLEQPSNADRLVLAGVALRLNKFNFKVHEVLDFAERLQKDENIQINVKRFKTLAMINSKRKYRAVDLIEFVLQASKWRPTEELDDQWLYKEWISPKVRMGFIKGNYLDVYAAAIGIVIGVFAVIIWGVIKIGKLMFRKLFKSSEDKTKKE
ncbi:17259_t:CDS:2 [Funneliformis geosporum]|uniref:17259_t:CDS:1 n=1 Tax=Funneliformis geosporum TaxID=1117311 RepID=A0A9W4WKA9_9GLOM|nr:17259_t:CDS:2 [Funneliformis geosporum]